jgi:hypothetical protein
VLVGSLMKSPALQHIDLSLNRLGPRAVVPLEELARSSLKAALLLELALEQRWAAAVLPCCLAALLLSVWRSGAVWLPAAGAGAEVGRCCAALLPVAAAAAAAAACGCCCCCCCLWLLLPVAAAAAACGCCGCCLWLLRLLLPPVAAAGAVVGGLCWWNGGAHGASTTANHTELESEKVNVFIMRKYYEKLF